MALDRMLCKCLGLLEAHFPVRFDGIPENFRIAGFDIDSGRFNEVCFRQKYLYKRIDSPCNENIFLVAVHLIFLYCFSGIFEN